MDNYEAKEVVQKMAIFVGRDKIRPAEIRIPKLPNYLKY